MLGIDLNVGVPKPFTSGGTPPTPGPPANSLLTENSEPLLTEAGENIVYE
jgi:hypothetical protein